MKTPPNPPNISVYRKPGNSDNPPKSVTVTSGWGRLPNHDKRLPVPVESLPPLLQEYVQALAAHFQVPQDLVLLPSLTVLSGCTRGRVQVKGRYLDGSCAIYTAVFLPPGEGKSPTLMQISKPLRSYERNLQQQRAREVRHNEEQREMLNERVKALRQRVARNPQDLDLQAEYDQAQGERDSYVPMHTPRLIGQDVTPEALATLLAEQGETFTLLSAEGGLIGTLGGRYSEGRANLDLVNAAFSCEPVTVDRQGRPPVHLARLHLAIGLTVQPNVLEEMQRNTTMTSRGFLDRFLVAQPESLVGSRTFDAPPLPDALISRWENSLHAILKRGTQHLDAGTLTTLQVTPDSLETYAQWWTRIEARLSPSGDLVGISGWVSKLRGTVLRIAGLFALLNDPETSEVKLSEMQSALATGDYLITHALHVFGGTAMRAPAARILTAVKGMPQAVFTEREILRKVQNQSWLGHDKAGAVRGELAHLQHLGYVRKLPKEYGSQVQPWERHPDM